MSSVCHLYRNDQVRCGIPAHGLSSPAPTGGDEMKSATELFATMVSQLGQTTLSVTKPIDADTILSRPGTRPIIWINHERNVQRSPRSLGG